MKFSQIISLLAATAAAAPLEPRDGPSGGMLAGLLGGGLDLGKLLGGGMGGMDMGKLAASVSPEMMKTFFSLMTKMSAEQKAMKIETLEPKLRKDAKRIKIVYGPYRVKGTATKGKVGNSFSLDPSGTGYMNSIGSDFPRDISIIDSTSGLFDENFQPIDIGKGLYNHHNVFIDTSTTPPASIGCEVGKPASSGSLSNLPISFFIGGATESSGIPYTSLDGKFNSAYYLAKDAKIGNMIDVVNYNKDDKTIYSISEIEYVPGKIEGAIPAYASVIDIGMCSGQMGAFVHPPKGQKKWTLTGDNIMVTQDGYFLANKAHFHDGGVDMQMYVNGALQCDSKAIYGGVGHEGKMPSGEKWEGISGTSICPNVIKVKKGDKVKFVANFDVEAHPEREQEGSHGEMEGMAEGMALWTGSFAVGA